MDSRQIVKQFLATEKSTHAKENGKYSFRVDSRANKFQIRRAVEDLFKVQVDSVRTMIVAGKIKRYGRYEGKTATWKKAVVQLKGEETIAEFENL